MASEIFSFSEKQKQVEIKKLIDDIFSLYNFSYSIFEDEEKIKSFSIKCKMNFEQSKDFISDFFKKTKGYYLDEVSKIIKTKEDQKKIELYKALYNSFCGIDLYFIDELILNN
jgi:F0F1-type ATP synthase delta subunit